MSESPPGGTTLDNDRLFSRLGAAAAVTGMLAWAIGVAMIPTDAKLADGGEQLARVLRAHTGQLYAAGLLAVLGAVLLTGFFAVLGSLIRPEQSGWVWLRISLAGCVITQTLVTVGAGFALVTVHAAAGNAAGGLVALGWRALWLTFLASALPTMMFTATGVIGLSQAGLSPPWVSGLGWLSTAAHLLAMLTLAQDGAFAPDGIIATLTPLTTVLWILALAVTLPRSLIAPRVARPGHATVTWRR
jgi:hypothetical protein